MRQIKESKIRPFVLDRWAYCHLPAASETPGLFDLLRWVDLDQNAQLLDELAID